LACSGGSGNGDSSYTHAEILSSIEPSEDSAREFTHDEGREQARESVHGREPEHTESTRDVTLEQADEYTLDR